MGLVSRSILSLAAASVSAIGICVACSGSQGPAGPVLSGNRSGVVYLFDQFGGSSEVRIPAR